MKNNDAIKQGLILSSIFITLLLLTVFTPLGIITIYFLPVPFIIYSYLNQTRAGIGMALINLSIAIIIGASVGGFLGLMAVSIGVTMGLIYKKGNALPAYVSGIIAAIINFVLLLAIGDLLLGINIVDSLEKLTMESLAAAESALNGFLSQEQLNDISGLYRDFINTINQLLPFIIISYSMFIVSLNHVFAGKLMSLYKKSLPRFAPIRDWVFPKSIIFYYLISIIIVRVDFFNDLNTIKLVAINLYPLLQIVMLLQGLSFLLYYGYRKGYGKVYNTFVIIALFMPIISQLIQTIGIIDLGFDLRKKLKF